LLQEKAKLQHEREGREIQRLRCKHKVIKKVTMFYIYFQKVTKKGNTALKSLTTGHKRHPPLSPVTYIGRVNEHITEI